MKFISVRDLCGKSADIWRELVDEREMVITRNGRPVAILAAVDDASLDGILSEFRRARAFNAVADIQRGAVGSGLDALSPEEIDAEVAEVRERRARGERRESIDWAIAEARSIGERIAPFDATASIRDDRDSDGS